MPEMMLEALNLALYGMGTVFIFLTVLVGLTTLMSRFALYLDALDPPPAHSPRESTSNAPQNGNTSPALVAAVAAAVKQYRAQQHESKD